MTDPATNLVAEGRLPSWACVPLPTECGIFLTQFVPDPFGAETARYKLRVDKHGGREIDNTNSPKRWFLKVSTFVAHDMLSDNQATEASRLSEKLRYWQSFHREAGVRLFDNTLERTISEGSAYSISNLREIGEAIHPTVLKTIFPDRKRWDNRIAA
jgi:hypothetical protein